MDRELTEAEKATNYETLRHINDVRWCLAYVQQKLYERGIDHDQSKLKDPELEAFVRMTPKLKGSTYGSDEYKGMLKELGPALEHHYANNRHHPEHHPNGIRDMNLVDLIEMLCDWYAATSRHADGDLAKSLIHNEKRFNIPPDIMNLLWSTALAFHWVEKRPST